MKIIILNYGLHISGVSRTLVNLANALAERGHQVTVKLEIIDFTLAAQLRSDVRLSLFLKEPKPFGHRIKGFNRFYVRWLDLVKRLPPRLQYHLVVREKYDAEIAFNRGLAAKIISGSCNKDAARLVWVHNDYTKCGNPFAGFQNKKEAVRAYRRYDKIVCVSQQAAVAFQECFGIKENVRVCDNVMDEKRIYQMAKLPAEEIFRGGGSNPRGCGTPCGAKGIPNLAGRLQNVKPGRSEIQITYYWGWTQKRGTGGAAPEA